VLTAPAKTSTCGMNSGCTRAHLIYLCEQAIAEAVFLFRLPYACQQLELTNTITLCIQAVLYLVAPLCSGASLSPLVSLLSPQLLHLQLRLLPLFLTTALLLLALLLLTSCECCCCCCCRERAGVSAVAAVVVDCTSEGFFSWRACCRRR
jgi:hypothetical protein